MTNNDLEELLAEVFCLLLHDCGLFLHQELDSFLFKSFSRVIIRINSSTKFKSLLPGFLKLLGLPVPPGRVVLHHLLPLGHQLLAGLVLPHLVLGVELVAVPLQVLLDVLQHVLGQQRRGSGPPGQLAELVNICPLEDLALEIPHPIGVVHLVGPPRYASDDVSP